MYCTSAIQHNSLYSPSYYTAYTKLSALALIIVGIILLVLGYFLPVPSWARSLLIAVGAICLIIGIILFVLPYITGALFIMPQLL